MQTPIKPSTLVAAIALACGLAGLTSPLQAQSSVQSNALKRCEAHAHRADCEARVRGGSDVRVTGSVRGGGILRENLSSAGHPHGRHFAPAHATPVIATWDRRTAIVHYARGPVPAHAYTRDPLHWHNH